MWPPDLRSGSVTVHWSVDGHLGYEGGAAPAGAAIDMTMDPAPPAPRAPVYRMGYETVGSGGTETTIGISTEGPVPSLELSVELIGVPPPLDASSLDIVVADARGRDTSVTAERPGAVDVPGRCAIAPCEFEITLTTRLRSHADAPRGFLAWVVTVSPPVEGVTASPTDIRLVP
jgi:hypothetical protein